jgi:hypothetical protein
MLRLAVRLRHDPVHPGGRQQQQRASHTSLTASPKAATKRVAKLWQLERLVLAATSTMLEHLKPAIRCQCLMPMLL